MSRVEDEMENLTSVKKFKNKEVEEQDLQRVFELTTKAPTAFNLPPYRFLVLSSEQAIKKAVASVPPVNKWISSA